jgi:hypothetical protein
MVLRFTEPVESGLGGVRVHGSDITGEFDER